MSPTYSKKTEPNCAIHVFGRTQNRYLSLVKFVMDFRYIALFRNQSKRLRSKIVANFRIFGPLPTKITEEWTKCVSRFFVLDLGPDL